MASATPFVVARWFLRRLRVALLVALTVVVAVRQLDEGGADVPPPAGPQIGRDHWHAAYRVIVCGEPQPNFPTWPGGVHTHDDGIIHIHPTLPSEEGQGARLGKWFEYGGGILNEDEMRMPGRPDVFRNGDTCPDGSEAILQVSVNGEKLDDWSGYIPQDGDRVLIVFGPE